MKKFLTLLLALTLTISTGMLTACGIKSNSDIPPISSDTTPEVKSYTVTFEQYDQADIKITVEKGKALTDIPTPANRTGYSVKWDKTAEDLANITQNLTVKAVYTANQYTVTYDADGGIVDKSTETFTYDSPYTLQTPEKEDYTFLSWTHNGKAVAFSGDKWNIAEDVTLVAAWQAKDMCEVTFIQADEVIKTVKVEKGESLSAEDIPKPVEKTGYTVSWNYTDEQITNIQGPVTIYAKEDAKTYTVKLKASENGSILTQYETITLIYNTEYDLSAYAKANTGYKFKSWMKDGQEFPTKGDWKVDSNDVELIALFEAKKYYITLNVNGGNKLDKVEFELVYGANYDFGSPTRGADDDYTFVCWRINDKNKGTEIESKGTWLWDVAETVTLYAEWHENYTKNY